MKLVLMLLAGLFLIALGLTGVLDWLDPSLEPFRQFILLIIYRYPWILLLIGSVLVGAAVKLRNRELQRIRDGE